MVGKTELKTTVEAFGPRSREVIDLLLEYEVFHEWALTHYHRPMVWDSAKGCQVKDADGKEYLDFTSAFATGIAGHGEERVLSALIDQAKRLTHAPDSPTLPRALLAKKLAEVMPKGSKRSMFGLNGGDALEIAMKLARAHKRRMEMIAFIGGFHGRGTFGCASLTSVKQSRVGILPVVPGVFHVPYAYCYRCWFGQEYPECDLWCTKYIERLLEGSMTVISEPAAMVVEPVLGAGGYVVPPEPYLPELRRITRDHDMLLIVDEVQTAFGRYGGAMTACDALGITPDIITLGKGLTGGYPLAATVTTDEIAESWKLSGNVHSATFTGNPLMCAVALAQIDVVLELKLPERVRGLEKPFREALQDNLLDRKTVGEVSTKGLFGGVEIVKDRKSKKPADPEFVKRIADIALEKGLIVLPCDGTFSNRIGIAPPLIITRDLIEKGARILGESVKIAEDRYL